MASTTLAKLLQGTRPYIPFTFLETPLFCRKLSISENEELSKTWEAVYAAEYKRIAGDPDSVMFSSLKRSEPKALAKYIAMADEKDLSYQAAAEMDDAPLDSPEVISRTKELVSEREAELLDKVPLSNMLDLAIQRRAHFAAADKAAKVTLRSRIASMVYDENKEPLFASEADVSELDTPQFEELMQLVADAITPPKPADEVQTPTDPLP